MPKKTKKLNAATGAEVKDVVDDYLERKNLSRYIKFNYIGLHKLKGPVKVQIVLNWTPSVGGTVTIEAADSANNKIPVSKTTVVIPPDSNADEVQDVLEEAGLW